MRAVEIPLHDLRAPELRGDLRRENPLTNGAADGRLFVVKNQIADKFLRDGWMRVRDR